MTPLFEWILGTTAVALGLALVALVVERLLSPRPAIRHALWLIVLVKLCVPPLVAWPWALEVPAPALVAQATPAPDPLAVSTARTTTLALSQPAASLAPPIDGTAGLPTLPLVPTLLGLWLLGACAAALRQGRRLARLFGALRGSSPAPGWILSEVETLASRVGVRAPRTRLDPGGRGPLIAALGRTVLLLPAGLATLENRTRLRAVIAHELAHVARRDHFVGWLELASSVLWWWNPLVPLVRRRLHESAELACDARVLAQSLTTPRSYAETLVEVGAGSFRGSCPEVVAAPALGLASRDLRAFERRLTMIMKPAVPHRVSRSAWAGIALLLAVAFPTFSVANGQRRVVAPDPPTVQDEEDDRWKVELSQELELTRGVTRLAVSTGAGSIRVLPGKGERVRVAAVIRADDDVPQAKLTEVFADHVRVEMKGDLLEVSDLHQIERAAAQRQGQETEHEGWQVTLHVYLPRALAVSASSGAGSVTVEDAVEGDAKLHSGAGSVTLKLPEGSLASLSARSGAGSVRILVGGVEGELRASSGAGTVQVSLVHDGALGGLDASSGAGSVSLSLPHVVSADFDLETPVGSIAIDAALGLEVKKGIVGSSARGPIGGGGPKYRMHSGAGSIEVTVGNRSGSEPKKGEVF